MSDSAKYPVFHEDLAAKLAALLIGEGLPGDRAHALARRHVDDVRRDWGGMKVYIPMGRDIDNAARNAEIVRRWNGRNTAELCREYRISEPHLRRIAGRSAG